MFSKITTLAAIFGLVAIPHTVRAAIYNVTVGEPGKLTYNPEYVVSTKLPQLLSRNKSMLYFRMQALGIPLSSLSVHPARTTLLPSPRLPHPVKQPRADLTLDCKIDFHFFQKCISSRLYLVSQFLPTQLAPSPSLNLLYKIQTLSGSTVSDSFSPIFVSCSYSYRSTRRTLSKGNGLRC
jgi:hypothetical protein